MKKSAEIILVAIMTIIIVCTIARFDSQQKQIDALQQPIIRVEPVRVEVVIVEIVSEGLK